MLEKKDNSDESLIDIVPDECIELIPSKNKKEKLRLINVFERLKTQLQKDEREKIADVYKVYVNEEKYNKHLRSRNKCLSRIFIFILQVFAMYNLWGIFLIIPIKDLLFKLLISSVRCYFGGRLCEEEIKNEFVKQTHFYDCFLNESLKKPNDFKLTAFWSFIGLKFLKSCGFRKTSILFLILNSILLFFIYNFNFDFDDDEINETKYNISKIIFLLLLWFFIGLTIGGSTLLSQQTLIKFLSIIVSDNIGNSKEDEKKEIEFSISADNNCINEEGELKEDNNDDKSHDNEKEIINNKDKNVEEELKKIIDYANKKKDEIKIKKQQGQIGKEELIKDIKEICNLDRNIGIKLEKTNKKKIIDKNQQIESNCFLIVSRTTIYICFLKYIINKYLIDDAITQYYNNYNNKTNQTNINISADNFTESYEIKKAFFIKIYKIYFMLIIISIILYSIFKCCALTKKDESKLDNSINSNNNSLPSSSIISLNKKRNSNCYNICCVWKFFFELFNYIFYFESTVVQKKRRKVGCCKLCGETIKNYCDNAFCNIINCQQNKLKCCCCCCNYNEDDYDKDTQCFCYCYQEEGFCSFIDKFITNDTQKTILPSIILYFLINLMSIGSEKEFMDKMLMNDENYEIFEFELIFVATFFLYVFYSIFIKKSQNKIKNEKINSGIVLRFLKKANYLLYHEYFLFFLNGLYSFLRVICYFLNLKEYDNLLITSSILFKRFFIFSFNYYCTTIKQSIKGNELFFSQSTLITIYLSISDLIIMLLQKFFFSDNNKDYTKLYIIQLICSLVFFVFIILFLMINGIIFFWCKKWKLYYCFEGSCLCQCCCCDEDAFCRCCYCHCCEANCSYCDCSYCHCLELC